MQTSRLRSSPAARRCSASSSTITPRKKRRPCSRWRANCSAPRSAPPSTNSTKRGSSRTKAWRRWPRLPRSPAPGRRCATDAHGKAPEGGAFRRGADQANEAVLLAVLAFLAFLASLAFLAVLAFLATLGFLAVLAFLALVLLVLVLLSAFLTILVCHCSFSL